MTGKYKAVPGNADCLNCDAGKYSGVAGVTACQECLAVKSAPASVRKRAKARLAAVRKKVSG